MNRDMKGWSEAWYEICNVDGHPLVLTSGENRFPTEELAAQTAAVVCVDYRDTVTVKQHTITIARIFHANITAVEV